jgi:hypothetical protein
MNSHTKWAFLMRKGVKNINTLIQHIILQIIV